MPMDRQLAQFEFVRDTGVLLGYLSEPHQSEIRASEESFHTIDESVNPLFDEMSSNIVDPKRTVEGQGVTPQYDPIGRSLHTPPLFKRALQGKPDSQVVTQTANSILYHEMSHYELGRREAHLYEGDRLGTYVATLTMLHSGNTQITSDSTTENTTAIQLQLDRCVGDIVYSEIAQEAVAISAQRYQLETSSLDQRTKEAVSDIVDRSIESLDEALIHDDPHYLEQSPVHALGDWLRQRWFADSWDIDPVEYAFGVATEFKHPRPDVALLAATCVDPDEISNCDPSQQVTLLTEQLASLTGGVYRYIVDPSHHESQINLNHRQGDIGQFLRQDATTRLATAKHEVLQELVGQNQYEAIPVVADSYLERRPEVSLWSILDEMHVTTLSNQNERLHHVSIPERVFQWADGTRLLEMAIELWKLREEVFMRMFRAWRCNSSHNPAVVLEFVQELQQTGSASGYTPEDFLTVDSQEIKEQYNRVTDQIDDYRDQYASLLTDLRRLGKALYEDDKSTIENFV